MVFLACVKATQCISMLKLATIDIFIVLLMFALLPVDMINGILLTNNINLPISLSQSFKFLLLLCLLIRFILTFRLLITILIITFCLLTPSLYQLISSSEGSYFFLDFIKISKYLAPFMCFLFFVDAIKRNGDTLHPYLIGLVQFSYAVLAINILIKYIGLGYPAYKSGEIGTKGFFFAGNEISALLIILSSIIAFVIWKKGLKIRYFAFLALNLLAGLTISSKTAILGILLVFFTIPFQGKSLKLNKFLPLVTVAVVLLPLTFFLSWKFILNSSLIIRLEYFYKELDLWTFVLSSRNVFLANSFETYLYDYDIVEKIIGVGQTRYEYLNDLKVVEMDIVDIFFTYGVLGLLIFLFIMFYLFVQSKRFAHSDSYPFANLVSIMTLVLLLISTLAGHVFGSGMSAVFLGLLFGLMYLKEKPEKVQVRTAHSK